MDINKIVTALIIIAIAVTGLVLIDARQKRKMENMTPEEKEKYQKTIERNNQTIKQAMIFSIIFNSLHHHDN